MSYKIKIILGGVFVMIASCLTMATNIPGLYTPYSFTIIIPALFISVTRLPEPIMFLLSPVPLLSFYFLLSFLRSSFKISKLSLIFAALSIIASLYYLVISISYGFEYQGALHTKLMFVYNIILISIIMYIARLNIAAPNQTNYLLFHIILFSWLGWVAFPWLGELL